MTQVSSVSAERPMQEAAKTSVSFLNAFESLGDNCEFAFVQNKLGIESGGLLRWAVVPAPALLKALEQRFEGLYDYDRVVGTSDAMVRDEEYGFFFHSKMRSKVEEGKREFILQDEPRRAIYDEELKKVNYLKSKLITRLEHSGSIFVYKRNLGIKEEMAQRLCDALRSYNPSNFLMLVEANSPERPMGEVWLAGPGLIGASIDRFAPYERADDASFYCWLEICRKAHLLATAASAGS